MAKRNADPGLLDGLYGIATLLPWWVDLVIAGGSFAGLHEVATAPVRPALPGDAGNQMTSTLWRALAQVGQVVIPLVFVAGAFASVVARRRRRRLVNRAGSPAGAQSVSEMSWREFELLVGEVFRRRGYSVEEVGGGGPDGGVDLVLHRGGDVALVQCKHWRSKQIGVGVVRELLGAMTAQGAKSGAVVTSGRFTSEAERFAQDQRIELLDGAALRGLARDSAAGAPTARVEVTEVGPSLGATAKSPQSTPSCPVCARHMVERTARRGTAAGSRFWGCPAYPSCRGTRQLRDGL